MKLSDVKTFRDLCASFFVLEFEPERKTKDRAQLIKELEPGLNAVFGIPKKKRSRTKKGRYKADNPKTKDTNEAYE